MNEATELVTRLADGLPHFNDGRINYSSAREAPVINCAVYAGDKVLLLKRSADTLAYPEKWNGVSGFIDRIEPPEQTARRELQQEIGLSGDDFVNFEQRTPYTVDDHLLSKIWHVFPVRVELAAVRRLELNEEHTDYVWIHPSEVTNYDILPDFAQVLRATASL